ncbi:MAG: transposase [Pyrinomonadaceae bacterium]
MFFMFVCFGCCTFFSFSSGYAHLFAEKLGFSDNLSRSFLRLCRPSSQMFQVSRDKPAYYLTSVTHQRLPIFRTETVGQIVCKAFAEARRKYGFLIFAYVIMLDHIHIITDCKYEISETLRYLNGISAKRLLDHLKANELGSSLAKLRIQERGDKHKYSVYQHHPNAFRITGEEALWQKVQYIHLNPVRAGLVEHPDEYLFSSARQWHGKPLDNEPLLTDHRQIRWRK